MLKRQYRLQRSEDFERLRREGRPVRHPYMTVSILPNGLPHNRYGFITPKRLGKAVSRNRIRRLLREAVRLLHPHLKDGLDVVIIARDDALRKPFEDIYHALMTTLRRATILEDELERSQLQ